MLWGARFGRRRPNPAHSNHLHSLWTPFGPAAGPMPVLTDLVSGGVMEPKSTTLFPAIKSNRHGSGVHTQVGGGLQRTGRIGWDPQGAGGFAPVTALYFGQYLNGTGSGANVFGLYSASGPRLNIYLANTALLPKPSCTFRLSSDVNLETGLFIGQGDLICIVATMRSATDHEIVAHLFDGTLSGAGTVVSLTSSSNAGSAGAAVTAENIGQPDPAASSTSFSTELVTFAAATWLRPMPSAEMYALAVDPLRLLLPAARVYPVAAPADVEGELAVTLDAATLSATGTVPNTGALTVTLDAAAVDAAANVNVSGSVIVTLDDVAFSFSGQVGAGVAGELGDLVLTLDDATLTGVGTVDVAGEVVETLQSASVLAAAVAGTNGPFAQRPLLVLN